MIDVLIYLEDSWNVIPRKIFISISQLSCEIILIGCGLLVTSGFVAIGSVLEIVDFLLVIKVDF